LRVVYLSIKPRIVIISSRTEAKVAWRMAGGAKALDHNPSQRDDRPATLPAVRLNLNFQKEGADVVKGSAALR
jgi:hypothetical protein